MDIVWGAWEMEMGQVTAMVGCIVVPRDYHVLLWGQNTFLCVRCYWDYPCCDYENLDLLRFIPLILKSRILTKLATYKTLQCSLALKHRSTAIYPTSGTQNLSCVFGYGHHSLTPPSLTLTCRIPTCLLTPHSTLSMTLSHFLWTHSLPCVPHLFWNIVKWLMIPLRWRRVPWFGIRHREGAPTSGTGNQVRFWLALMIWLTFKPEQLGSLRINSWIYAEKDVHIKECLCYPKNSYGLSASIGSHGGYCTIVQASVTRDASQILYNYSCSHKTNMWSSNRIAATG